jgi:ankyrin repeat protein
MKNRFKIALIMLSLAGFSNGCGIFFPSHHDTLDYKAIHAAAEGGDLAAVQSLVKSDRRLVEARDWENLTPLHLAAFHGHKDVVEFLISQGACVNAKTTAGVTPLHMAAQIGNQDVAQVLLDHKAKINTVDSSGWTPLARAEKWDHPDMVKFLQAHGGHK